MNGILLLSVSLKFTIGVVNELREITMRFLNYVNINSVLLLVHGYLDKETFQYTKS